MVFVEKWPLFQLFFLGTIGQENVFYDILKRKNTFLGYKAKSSKSRKIDIFPKGITHGFRGKMAIFPTFFFRHYRPGKCLLRYPKMKKHLSRLKSQKIDIFQKGIIHGFWSKNGHFSNISF